MKKIICLILTCCICVSLTGCVVIEFEPIENGNNVKFESQVILFEIDPEYPRYNAIVEIKNTGNTVIDLGYSVFSVEDENNHLIATDNSTAIYSQPSLIKPGEVGYYFTQRNDLPTNFDRSLSYHLVYSTDYIHSATYDEIIDFEVTDVSFPNDDYSKIIGKVVNIPYSGCVDVWCICYDINHNIVNISGTIIEIGSGETSIFEIYNYAAFGMTNITEYEIFARNCP